MTMTNQLPIGDLTIQFPEAIDSTMLSAFGCPQKFFLEFCLRKVPGSGRSIDLHAGGCMAKAFELVRRAYYKHSKTTAEAFEIAWPVFARQWDWIEPKAGNYKDFVNCWCAVEAYFQQYPMEHDFFQPLMLSNGEPAVEFQFGIPLEGILHPLTGNPMFFSGRADMLAVNRDNPVTCYVMDEKTTKGIGDSWPYQWDMRGQFYGYTWAARQHGHRCAGALVRGIAIQQTGYKFAEKFIPYTQWQIDNWERTMMTKVRQMVSLFEQSLNVLERGVRNGWDTIYTMRQLHDLWLQNFADLCTTYGRCVYTDLCTQDLPWDFYLDYDTRIWNPMHQDPTDETPVKAYEEITMADFLEGM